MGGGVKTFPIQKNSSTHMLTNESSKTDNLSKRRN